MPRLPTRPLTTRLATLEPLLASLEALQARYGRQPRRNVRSAGLLHKLGFEPADAERVARFRDEADELVMTQRLGVGVDPGATGGRGSSGRWTGPAGGAAGGCDGGL